MKRGEVWLCALDPTVGREIRKARPCLIVSPDDLNRQLSTAIVAPLTRSSRPTRFRIAAEFEGVAGLILPDQMRTLDERRFIKRLGEIDDATFGAVLNVLQRMFAS